MPFVHEFLFKAGADGESAWHVILACVDTNGFGEPAISLKGPLTPEQATELGWTLEKILAEVK